MTLTSSVCLAKMVQNFIEDSNEKQPSVRCNRNRCNCFNGNCKDSFEDEFDSFGGFGDSNLSSSVEAIEILKVIKSIADEKKRRQKKKGEGVAVQKRRREGRRRRFCADREEDKAEGEG